MFHHCVNQTPRVGGKPHVSVTGWAGGHVLIGVEDSLLCMYSCLWMQMLSPWYAEPSMLLLS